MKFKNITITVIVLILVIAGIAFAIYNINTQDKSRDDLQKIKVSEVTRSVFYAPQYVAISNGYFKDEGLEIDLTTGQGADNVMTAVLSNQVDIGFAGPEASIYVYNEGKTDHTQVFAQLTKTDGSFLVSSKNIKDFKWTDLKGKTVIPGRKGGVPYMTLLYVLRKNGINPEKDLTLDDSIDFDLMASAFSTGEADFVTLFEPTASQIELSGKGYIVSSVGEEAGEIPYTAYFAKKSYIEKNKDIVQKFTNAIYKGQQYVDSHTSKEIAEAIQEFFPDTKIDLLEQAINSYRQINAWSTSPYMTEGSFDLLQKVIQDAGELEKKASYNDVVNNSFADTAVNNK